MAGVVYTPTGTCSARAPATIPRSTAMFDPTYRDHGKVVLTSTSIHNLGAARPATCIVAIAVFACEAPTLRNRHRFEVPQLPNSPLPARVWRALSGNDATR